MGRLIAIGGANFLNFSRFWPFRNLGLIFLFSFYFFLFLGGEIPSSFIRNPTTFTLQYSMLTFVQGSPTQIWGN